MKTYKKECQTFLNFLNEEADGDYIDQSYLEEIQYCIDHNETIITTLWDLLYKYYTQLVGQQQPAPPDPAVKAMAEFTINNSWQSFDELHRFFRKMKP